MPAKGYSVVTITKEVNDEIEKNMEELNKKAGYRKFRSKSHFLEEAVMGYVVNIIQKGATDPETLVKNLVEAVWDRYDILKAIMKRLVDLPPEEGIYRLERMLDQDDLKTLNEMCVKLIELKAGTPGNPGRSGKCGKNALKKKMNNIGPHDYHAVIDFTGKVLKADGNFSLIFGRRPGEMILSGQAGITEETRQTAFRILRESIYHKHCNIDHFILTLKDGRSFILSGTAHVIDWNYQGFSKALEIWVKVLEKKEKIKT